MSTTPATMATQSSAATDPPVNLSTWRLVFRIVRWSTYLAAFVTIILVLHKTPAPAVQISSQAAARAEAKVEAVEQSASQGLPATLRLDESELNSMLADRLTQAQAASAPAPPVTGIPTPAAAAENIPPSANDVEQMRSNVRDVKVQMEGDLVKAYVVFDVHGKDMTLDLAGHLSAVDGYLKFVPVSGQLGSLPIPQSALESAVQRLMESPDNREKLKLPPDIADLRIVNGELVTTYH